MEKALKFGAVAAVMALASCSQEEVQPVVTDADQIRYSSEVAAISRAADSYCNLDKPADFDLWAFNADGSAFINADRIVSNDLGNTYTNASGVRYWPVKADGSPDGDIDFFAAKNHRGTLAFGKGAYDYPNVPKFRDYAIENDVARQVDLIYAAAMGKNKGHETVRLNFRHALSQVCFRALNHTTNLNVAIRSVSIGHLYNKGTFTFPLQAEGRPQPGRPQDTAEAETDWNPGNWEDSGHDDFQGELANQQLVWQGTWDGRGVTDDVTTEFKGMTSADAYTVATPSKENAAFTAVPRTDKSRRDYTNLTCPGPGHENGFAGVFTLLPQAQPKWDPTPSADKLYHGAYFVIDALLENVTTDGEGNEVATTVYDGRIAVPVDVTWYPGFRYIYTFVFDDEHAGGFTDDPSNPQPVLNPLKYDVTVDDFIPVAGGDHFIGGGDANNTNSTIVNFFDGALGKNIVKSYSSDVVGGIGDYNGGTPYARIIFDDNLDSYAPEKEGYHFIGWGHWDGKTEPSQVIVKPGQKSGGYYIGYTYNFAPMYEADEEKRPSVTVEWYSADGTKLFMSNPVKPENSHTVEIWQGTLETYLQEQGKTINDVLGFSKAIGGKEIATVKKLFENNGKYLFTYDCSGDADNSTVKLYLVFDEAQEPDAGQIGADDYPQGSWTPAN